MFCLKMDLVVSDFVDNQWLTLNLMKAMGKVDLCAKRLRSVACQKSVPKKETIARWVSFGELHREHLEALLSQVNDDYRFIDESSGQAYDKKKTLEFLEMFKISLEFYADARDRALMRMKNPLRQVFA